MNIKASIVIAFLVLCLLIKFVPKILDWFIDMCVKRVLKKYTAAEKHWQKVREEREKWEKEHPFAPKWHHKRQELLRIELGAFMLFVDTGPRFSKAVLECNRKDIEKLAGEIVDDDFFFQTDNDEE